MEERCQECGGELCEHGNCKNNCAFTWTDECDCFTWDENLSGTEQFYRDLAQAEPTHAYKFPIYK